MLGVGQIGFQNPDQALADVDVFNGKDTLDAAEVARHPIGAARKARLRPGTVFKIEDAAVLEKAAEDTTYADVLAHALDPGNQIADAAHDELNLHTPAWEAR